MTKLQSETRTAPLNAQRFGQAHCPKCKDMLLAPVRSEHVSETLIRHFWSCDSCGHEFHTSVRFKRLGSGRPSDRELH
jgi:uncharacterized protein with PIN domain